MTEQELTRVIADLDARYRRVDARNTVPVMGDSCNDFWREVTGIVEKRKTGRYELVCVRFLEPTELVGDLADDIIDAEIDKIDALLAKLAPGACWVVPENDPWYDEESVSICFTPD